MRKYMFVNPVSDVTEIKEALEALRKVPEARILCFYNDSVKAVEVIKFTTDKGKIVEGFEIRNIADTAILSRWYANTSVTLEQWLIEKIVKCGFKIIK